uniref:Uncharacterized protein n=1 Tax=Kalanchoe fedtschenkoi TaxID=63787 RepID=A0A7N0VET7_KALFE
MEMTGKTYHEDDDNVLHASKPVVPDEEDEINDCPIEEVKLTVPITDDPTLPVLTFRTWVLGLFTCVLLAFVNQFFGYRNNNLSLGTVSAQIVVLPIGRLMASYLPDRKFKVPFFNWSFTLNPGPFSVKEHVLITVFATSGAGGVYAVHIVTIVKAFYHKNLHWMAGFLLALTTQMLGYGWAGLFRKYLVDSAYMWWPSNLINVSLFRALNGKEKRPRGGLTRLQFFFMVFTASFAYYIIPGYFFPAISGISVVCFIWRNSVTAQQIGSGNRGLGIGSFALDWNTVVAFLGTPLATPGFAMMNTLVGFVLTVYVLLPIVYWTNSYDAKKFPLITSHTFDRTGATYNISRVLDDRTFTIDEASYNNYSKLYMSAFFAFTYGLSFATLTSAISHVGLFHGKEIWEMWKKSTTDKSHYDVHTRIMKKNYKEVPQWWFHTILVLVFSLAVFTCEGFGKQLQLPWWGLIMACMIALFFTLPVGIIAATTNQYVGLNVITELIIGYIYPGKPLANVAFKTYGYISMVQAQSFLSDFKLGAYMKIPPVSMFIAQLVGTIVSSVVYFSTSWWMLTTIKNICNPDLLPEGSPWTCPNDEVFYNASIIWGVIGPGKMFTNKGVYPEMNWFFLFGFLAPVPVFLLSRKYPEKKWIRLINMPVLIGAAGAMPPARAVNYITWLAVGMFFNLYVYKKHKSWWARNNYVLSAALDAGLAFMGIFSYFALGYYDIVGVEWWGMKTDPYCDLARCPTAPGVVVEGCPVF